MSTGLVGYGVSSATGLVAYGVSSAAGPGVSALWDALCSGRSLRGDDGVCRWPEAPKATAMERLASRLDEAAAEALGRSGPDTRTRWGVVLASTKGATEDWIAHPGEPPADDPIAPVLDAFLARHAFRPLRRLGVSNACVSTHAALLVAERWLARGVVDDVLVLAVDEVRDFVTSGFRALGALSPTGARPMAADRDGLQLGEAAVALWLSNHRSAPFLLGPVGIETEGLSITRPSPDGQSLVRAALVALGTDATLDFVVAHGTATPMNDLVEARALAQAFAAVGASPETPIVGTKGCVGHTLGASGGIDIIAAAECLRRRELFPIGSTTQPDPALPVRAFHAGSPDTERVRLEAAGYRRALVSGLGFGGVHAAVTLARAEEVR